MTSFGGIWCAASHGSSPLGLMSALVLGGCAAAAPGEVVALVGFVSAVEEGEDAAAAESAGAVEALAFSSSWLFADDSSAAGGVPPPHAMDSVETTRAHVAMVVLRMRAPYQSACRLARRHSTRRCLTRPAPEPE
jgi:hypothetical protein